MTVLLWIIGGIIAGWLTGMMVKGSRYGLLGDLLVGLLVGLIGVQATSLAAQILVAALGGVVFVRLVHLIHPGTVSV